jgi:prophage tail gpP-like protein
MIIEVNGIEYSGWTTANASLKLDALSNVFHFVATAQDGKPLPFRGGESCSILADGERILTGSIEVVNVDGDSGSHTISIDGRDKTGDLVDSKIASLSDIRAPMTLQAIIQLVILHIGSTIAVIDLSGAPSFDSVQDLAAPEPGQDVWDFIEGLARKRQVLLTSDAYGNVVITRSSGLVIPATLQNLVNDNTNNVLTYAVSYDNTGRFNRYNIIGQLNPITINSAIVSTNESITHQVGVVTDTDIDPGRQFALLSENAVADPVDRAKWEMNIRKARSRVYSATVAGFRNQTGNLWNVNEIVTVNDDYAGINSRMLINSVQFTNNADGRETTLSLVDKNAYTLELEEPTTDKVGVGLT